MKDESTESVALFPVLGRRTALQFVKEPAEIQRIIVADDFRNFIYGIIRSFQQDLRIGDTKRGEELQWCGAEMCPEAPDKPADAHSSGGGIGFNTDRPVIILIKVRSSQLHFTFQVRFSVSVLW